jgi:IS30 family transposase
MNGGLLYLSVFGGGAMPHDTQLAALSNRNMKAICDHLNNIPRKCLAWRTPTEAFWEEMMKLG